MGKERKGREGRSDKSDLSQVTLTPVHVSGYFLPNASYRHILPNEKKGKGEKSEFAFSSVIGRSSFSKMGRKMYHSKQGK